MHNLSVSLWDLRTIPLWSKWTKDLTLYCLNKIKEIMVLILQTFRKPVRQTILLIGIIWWAQFQSYMFQIILEYMYIYKKKLDKISTPIPTPTPESFNSNSNSNSGSFNSNSNSGNSLEYQLQLQLREFQLQLQLRQFSWISTPTPTPTPEVSSPIPTPTPELTPTLLIVAGISDRLIDSESEIQTYFWESVKFLPKVVFPFWWQQSLAGGREQLLFKIMNAPSAEVAMLCVALWLHTWINYGKTTFCEFNSQVYLFLHQIL